MNLSEVLYEVSDGIAVVTLNRPDRLNAWTPTMEREVRTCMLAARDDAAVRVIILTGAGRAFCAGADMEVLKTIAPGSHARPDVVDGYDASQRGDWQSRYTYYPAIGKPIIGMLQGPVAGLGMVHTLYCDIRIAADNTLFTTAFARRGLIAEHGISWMLPRLVGQAHALDLLLSARKVGAAEALSMGLVNRVVPLEQLRAETFAYARMLATEVSPRSMAIMKRQVWESHFETLSEAVVKANAEMLGSFGTEDFREGVAHFVEKRPARFTGR